MEDTNSQDDTIAIDIDNNTIEESYEAEDNDHDDPYVFDNDTFQRLKQNNSSITSVYIYLNCGEDIEPFFNTVDWKKDGDCISNNTQLKKLHICPAYNEKYILGKEGHNLPTRQQLQDFFSCIYYRNSSIKELVISAIDISDKFGGGLIEGLRTHPSLVRLEIISKLGSKGCEALGEVLRHAKSILKDLRLPYCKLDDQGLGVLCDGLVGNSTLKKLDLSGNNKITSVGWRALSTVIQHPNCKLVNLDLNNTGITDEGSNTLGTALSGLSSLKVLDLSMNHSISSAGWQRLSTQLSQISVRCLHLRSNNINDDCVVVLGSIGTLQSIDMSFNVGITPIGWRSFFNSLQTRGTLVKLNISYNPIGDVGAAALGSLLSSITSLKYLDLNGTSDSTTMIGQGVTAQGWVSFFNALQDSNLDLKSLVLSYNDIDDEGMQLLVRTLSNMISLKDLTLGINRSVTPTGWLALTDYLQSPSFALKELYLSNNKINDDTVVAFTSSLVRNKTLETLTLDECVDEDEDNLIAERGWGAVSTLVCNKTSILETYTSNHTLQDLVGGSSEMSLPSELSSHLELNRNEDKVEVARQKILQTHFSSEDDATSKMQELLDMELEVMPTAIAWMGRPTSVDWKGYNVSGLSAMYNLTRRLPDVFDSSAHKKSSTAKRKRSV